MNNEIKETKIVVKIRKYNGDYGIGSVFNHEYTFVIQQLLENDSKENGLIKYSEDIHFCCDENIGTYELAKIKVEVPYIVNYEQLVTINDYILKIHTDSNYKYSESHYTKERFDPKCLNYIDIIIDNEEYEADNSEILEMFNGIINFKKYSEITNNCYTNLTNYMNKSNKSSYEESVEKFKKEDEEYRKRRNEQNDLEEETIVTPPIEKRKIELTEEYIDENGHSRERTKDVMIPIGITEDVFLKICDKAYNALSLGAMYKKGFRSIKESKETWYFIPETIHETDDFSVLMISKDDFSMKYVNYKDIISVLEQCSSIEIPEKYKIIE